MFHDARLNLDTVKQAQQHHHAVAERHRLVASLAARPSTPIRPWRRLRLAPASRRGRRGLVAEPVTHGA